MTGDIVYWETQTAAALDDLPVEADVRSREDAREIVVENDDWDRVAREEVIHALKARGFAINSPSSEDAIRVEVTPHRLLEDLAEVTEA